MRSWWILAAGLAAAADPACAADSASPPTTIKIGQTIPYSGPVSVTATHGRFQRRFFEVLNEQGGINGHKIDLISVDDAYSPPKAVEQTRKLVEADQVLFMFGSIGSPANAAVQPYLNAKGVPQLFITAGASRFSDAAKWPWTIGWLPTYRGEGEVYAKYILEHFPHPKIAILYQNDDLGKDYLQGFKSALGEENAKLIVAEQSFETSEPSIDSQVVTLQGSGADVFFYAGTQKFGAQEIRKVNAIGWKPARFIVSTTSSIASVLRPAGIVEMAEGVISAQFTKDVADPTWQNAPDMQAYLAWMKQYYPSADPTDVSNINGYMEGNALVTVLTACGDDLSRKNIMYHASHLDHLPVPLLLPGITLNSSPTNHTLIRSRQLVRLEHGAWVRIGEPIGD